MGVWGLEEREGWDVPVDGPRAGLSPTMRHWEFACLSAFSCPGEKMEIISFET